MEKVFSDKTKEINIYKLGNKVVNWYLVESPSEIYIIDTGFAGFWKQFIKAMQSLNRNLDEVSAVLLTHAHLDHTGFAERARQRTSAKVYIHESGADTVRFDHFDIPTELSGNLWRPKTLWAFMIQALKYDAFKVKPLGVVSTFENEEILKFPGNPKVIYTPGHSIDHCSFYFEDWDVLFSGDALCTSSPITFKKYPPHVMRAGDDTDLATKSLSAFEDIENVLMLPGHGQPWTGNLKNEIELIKERGMLL